MNKSDKNILINFSPLLILIVVTILGGLAHYLFTTGVEKTIVGYNEDTGKFIMKEAKQPEAGTIMINKGDSCQATELFVVCGQ